MQAVVLVGELAFMDDQPGIGVAGFDVLQDFIERLHNVAKALAQGNGGGKEGGRHGAGDGDAFGFEFLNRERFFATIMGPRSCRPWSNRRR